MRRLCFVALLCPLAITRLAAQDALKPVLPHFEEAPCPFKADAKTLEQVRCGYVTVLENRSVPDGRRLRLAVAIVKSRSRTPRPDPVVRVGGGPGDPSLARVPNVLMGTAGDMGELLNGLRDDRDVIFYDQRGVGFSEPVFCPEEAGNWGAAAGSPLARRERRRQAAARCGDSMRRLGFDLSQYNSAASALDLRDIRRALGYEQWNVHGHSYGSRLALVTMRNAPEGIRSVILSGTYPTSVASWFNLPGWTADVLARVSASCAAQPACRAAFPAVEQTFWRTLEELERNPMPLQLRRPNGRLDTVAITGAIFAGRVQDTMMSSRGVATIPLLVHAMSSRNGAVLSVLLPPAAAEPGQNPRQGPGLGFAVQCFEEAPLNTVALKEQMRRAYPSSLVDGGLFNDPSVCEGIHPFRADAAHTAPVESAIPALIVTGEFDPQTHRSNGPIVQRTLKASQLVDVPGAGHSGMFAHECTRAMVRDFLNAPVQKRDTSCVQAIPQLQFVTDFKSIRQ
jgi:pimeloyl-ACP methyl ester carboxylesterase